MVGLKVLLADGTLVQTSAGGANVNRRGSAIPGGDGPFLTGIFLGDGGSLGVKVEATLQITPAAPHVASAQWHFADLDSVWQALAQLAAIRETPYTGIGVAEGPPWILNFTTRASDPVLVDSYVRRIERVLAACGGQPKPADPTAVPNREWFINVDRAVVAFIFGRSAFLEAFKRIRTRLAERIRERRLSDVGIGLKVVIYPHTRHAMYTSVSIVFDRNVQGGRARAVELATETYEHIVALGGYLEPQQGVASRVIAQSWSPAYCRVFQGLKSALDPNNILNPGLWGVD
jgi:FAD/FMN-containing dehydrogenase